MDIYCPTCGEPWEFDTLHEEAQEQYGVPYYEEPDEAGRYYGNAWFTKVKKEDWNEDDYQKVYQRVKREFQTIGCKALKNMTNADYCKPKKPGDEDEYRDPTFGLTSAEAAGALYDILGDDMDGAAAMLEDMGF